MDFFNKKKDHPADNSLLSGLILLSLFIASSDLFGQESTHINQQTKQEIVSMSTGPLACSTFPVSKVLQKKGFVRGKISELNTNSPVCFADISTINNELITKSNSKGEFQLIPNNFPLTLKIRKFGYQDVTLSLNNPCDSLHISFLPLEIQKKSLSQKLPSEYLALLKKAVGKFKEHEGSEYPDPLQRKLIYCRIASSADTAVNSFFESYLHMNVNKYELQGEQTDIARYALTEKFIPGLSENRLEFKIDPYINLPIFIESYIKKRGLFVQNGSQIALVEVDLGETKNVYYIRVPDTSLVYIKSQFKSKQKNLLQGTQSAWEADRSSSTEISFSENPANPDNYLIDFISENEEFRLIQKKKADQSVSKNTLFAMVPDSSLIQSAVRDHLLEESLEGSKQQINFNEKYSISGKTTAFNSETEKLFLKPYKHDFWVQNSFVTPDSKEQKQIEKWETSRLFYSDNSHSRTNEIIAADSLVKAMNDNIVAVENVYVETDRPDYLAGDTIWFNAFVLDNLHMDSTFISKILYVDLIDAENKLQQHLKLLINNGRTNGDLSLSKDAKSGIYRLRAYTQFMRNFQSEYLFEKEMPVHQSNFNNKIVVNPLIKKCSEGDSVELYIKTILPDEYKATDKKLEVSVKLNDTMSVRKTFSFKKNLNGTMGFYVPSSLNCFFADVNLSLSDKVLISTQRLSLRLKSGINLMFFPESGKMVDGIESLIAFKAVDNKGNPTEFNADIVDENQNRVIHIIGDKTGVGKFVFTPHLNHSYKAVVSLSGNNYLFNLPLTEPKGYILNFNSNSNEFYIRNNENSFKQRHYLLISVRGAVYSKIESLLDTNTLKVHLPLELYPKGIVQITLFDSLFHPLAERLVFNNRHDQKMLIHLESDKKEYSAGERVNLKINVTDASGRPVESSLSVAVIDASKSDSTSNSPNIESYLYLTSELKGEIDSKLLNLNDSTLAGKRQTDLLMMTQGWTNFLWNSIRYTSSLKVPYPVEKAFLLKGVVYNYSSRKQLNDYRLDLFDLKSGFHDDTGIDGDNRFKITIPFFYNSHILFMQNRNKRERVENLSFTLDTITVPAIRFRNNELPYVSYKAGYLKALDRRFSEVDLIKGQDIKYINLPEVKIQAKSNMSGYSAPDKTIDLIKKDPTGKKYSSIFQLIYEEFGEKAFTASGFGTHGKAYTPILVVNGAPLTADECPPCYDGIGYSWAAEIPVNEVSDVKLFEGGSTYSQWLTPRPHAMPIMYKGLYIPPPDPQIYLPVVSLKTSSKSYRGNPRGAILFPFQGLYQAREFYQPAYEKDSNISDNRTTIYWNPEVRTDSTGKAKVSFYNSGMKGEAQIRISGVSYSLKDASSAISHYLSH